MNLNGRYSRDILRIFKVNIDRENYTSQCKNVVGINKLGKSYLPRIICWWLNIPVKLNPLSINRR